MRQSAGEPDGLVTCVLMWSPPLFVRGRASTVNSAVASRKTSAGYILKSHFKNRKYFRRQNVLLTLRINNSFGNTAKHPSSRVTMGTCKATTASSAQNTGPQVPQALITRAAPTFPFHSWPKHFNSACVHSWIHLDPGWKFRHLFSSVSHLDRVHAS